VTSPQKTEPPKLQPRLSTGRINIGALAGLNNVLAKGPPGMFNPMAKPPPKSTPSEDSPESEPSSTKSPLEEKERVDDEKTRLTSEPLSHSPKPKRAIRVKRPSRTHRFKQMSLDEIFLRPSTNATESNSDETSVSPDVSGDSTYSTTTTTIPTPEPSATTTTEWEEQAF